MRSDSDIGILKIMIILFPLIVLGNAIEYFFVKKENLKKITGKVSERIVKDYKCSGYYRSSASCEKTLIKLEGIKGTFHVSDYADRGAYIDGIQKGDTVSVYIRKWYQFILTFGAGKDIYGLEKNGESYYDIDRWKASNKAFILVFGFLSICFIPLYILERLTIKELIKKTNIIKS